MRHRRLGRAFDRSPSHRKAMFKNMASALFLTEREIDEDLEQNSPKVKGRIITTLPKAKEVRPLVEKCITIARDALQHIAAAEQYATGAARTARPGSSGVPASSGRSGARRWPRPWCAAPVAAADRRQAGRIRPDRRNRPAVHGTSGGLYPHLAAGPAPPGRRRDAGDSGTGGRPRPGRATEREAGIRRQYAGCRGPGQPAPPRTKTPASALSQRELGCHWLCQCRRILRTLAEPAIF